MRPRVLLVIGGLVAVLGVGAFALSGGGSAGAGDDGPRLGKQARRGPQDSRAEREVSDLAGKGDTSALVGLYGSWAGAADKVAARERILEALLARRDRQGLLLALRALASDESPLSEDPMLEVAVERLTRLWTDPALYQQGRDLLLVQGTDKPRVVLAESLARRTARLTDAEDPEAQQRTWLGNDLVDVYYQSGDEARPLLRQAVRTLGATDVVRLLEQGTEAKPTGFGTVKEEVDTIDRAGRELRDYLDDGEQVPSRDQAERELTTR